ncbi:MAG TPA: lysophospholipid acyltransferase family protein [Phycisphaerales bacterium]|nr:lysophospholipid acyltransferase family protein [Phycisphaerales bacterium]
MPALLPFFLALLLVWIAFAALCHRLSGAFRADPISDLAWGLSQIYVRVVHRLRVCGPEHLRAARRVPGPLVIVSNHTAGVDPVLIQSICPFEIRWMMMRSMMTPALRSLWDWLRIIPVDQDGRDSNAVRTALRHLRGGGALGIFAEGGIERPPQTIMPFEPGVGLLVLKSGALVLPVVIRGTPRCDSAFASLLRPSRATVEFLPPIDFSRSGLSAQDIASDLELLAARSLDWPRAPRPPREPLEHE